MGLYGSNSYAGAIATGTITTQPSMPFAPDAPSLTTPVTGTGYAPAAPPQTDNTNPGYIAPSALPPSIPFGAFPDSPDYSAVGPSPYGGYSAQPSAQGAPPPLAAPEMGGHKLLFIGAAIVAIYFLMK